MYFFFLFNTIFILLNFIKSTIVLDLKTLPKESYTFSKDKSKKSLVQKYYYSDIYSTIKIGNPNQEIPLLISINKNAKNSITITSSDYSPSDDLLPPDLFNITPFLQNNPDITLFTEKESSDFKNITEYIKVSSYDKDYEMSCIANDTMFFYKSLNLKEKIENTMTFELIKNPREFIPGEISIPFPINVNKNCFLSQLKKNNLINNYNYFFSYDKWDNSNGKLIIGAAPHELFSKKFNEKDLFFSKSILGSMEGHNWKLEFNYISIGDDVFSNKTVELIFNSDIIIAPKEIEDYLLKNFLENQINNKKCYSDIFFSKAHYSSTVRFYYCDKNLKNDIINKIPKINFNSRDFNYTFEINSDSFIIEEGDFIYFRIIFILGVDTWILGKPFSFKYQFVFNPESKQIGMYNPYYGKGGESSLKQKLKLIIIIIILCIIFTVLGIILGKKIYGLKRKQKANELNDDFEYTSAEIN